MRFANDMRMLKNVTVPTVFPGYTSRKVRARKCGEMQMIAYPMGLYELVIVCA